ncbi:MAG: hypothetical protein ACRD2L_25460 [Terriglobia bacterium]
MISEKEWKEAYIKQAEPLRKFSFKRFWSKDKVVAQLYMLAEIVKQHPNYPQPANHGEQSSSTGRSLSIPAFLQLLDNCNDITPFLVAHYQTLEESASQLDKEKLLDRLFKLGGGGGILYGLWKALCLLFIEPVLGIPCDFGAGGGGSLISSLTPLAWIFGGIGLLFLHKVLSSSLRKDQVIFRH